MIRQSLVPALAAGLAALLAGCVTDYQYRGGTGDYYYGQPAVEYRDYGYGYGDPYGSYGYPGGWSGSFGYGYGVGGIPYGYGGYPGYGYPYGGYGYPYWGGRTILVRPGSHGGRHHHGDHRDNDGDADDVPAGPSGGMPRRDRDDGGLTPATGPNLMPRDLPRPMSAVPSPRQQREREPRMQPAQSRGEARERDDGRNPIP